MRNPAMNSWVLTGKEGIVQQVCVKQPPNGNYDRAYALIGAFYFRKVKYFLASLQRLYENNIRVNNEFYVDSCINTLIDLGFSAKVFVVDNYICWGTPDDLRTFEYWQSFFTKCAWHPYSLEKEISMNKEAIQELNLKYRSFVQEQYV